MQYFKGDETELKFDAAGEPIMSELSLQKDEFLEGAYETGPLGDLIFDNDRSPLSNAIARDIFRIAFKEIFEAFVAVGTFEAYLTVFAKIFGDEAEVEFTVPAPGKLAIEITATGIELSGFITRYIQNNQYVYDQIVDEVGDRIVFKSVKGFTSQYELEQMLFEMVPDGIWTEITLTLG